MNGAESGSRFDTDLSLLVGYLKELRLILRNRDAYWSAWIDRVLGEIGACQVQGLDRLLRGYGGMGSLGDLVIGPADGQRFTPEEIALNNRLATLRTRCWELGTALRGTLPA